jgi:Icc-related predicted phosphoesterase
MLNYLRPVNDLHLDFYVPKNINQLEESLWYPKALETDKQTAFIISGDLWHSKKFLNFNNFSWLAKISQQFKYILFVLGNHDLWRGNLPKDYQDVKAEIKKQGLSNVFLLQDDSINLDGILFTGATLWTDFNSEPYVLMKAKEIMRNDYKSIRYGNNYDKLKSQDVRNAHIHSRNFIFEKAHKNEEILKNVVITHHAPSYLSIPEQYKSEHYHVENHLDYSNLDDKIKASDIDFWFHGHTHEFKDYFIGNTRIVNNPLGYYGHQKTDFNQELIFKI